PPTRATLCPYTTLFRSPAIEPGELDDRLRIEPGDLRRPVGRPRRHMRLQLVRSVRVARHIGPVDEPLLEEDVQHAADERPVRPRDRKSTRLNSSHVKIS